MASFYVYGFLLSLLIFSVATQVPVESNDKGDGFNKCMKFGMCECEDLGAWEECWMKLMLPTRKEVIKIMQNHEECEGVDASAIGEDPLLADVANAICVSPPEKWESCYERVKTDMGKYVDETANSEEEEKKQEKIHTENARKCTTAVVTGRCGGMDIDECPEEF